MPHQLRETAAISEATATAAAASGRMLVQFISPGWGSSGYYSPEVLQEAADNQIIPAGTHMYADHPTETEEVERPERSIRDLMAVTLEDARVSESGALVGDVQVFPNWRELLADEAVRESIGLSIRGDATDITEGTAEGRTGRIIEGLAHVSSVDFVTRAGRGGRVLSLVESAANRRAVRHGISETTVNDTREGLQTVLRDAYQAKDTWIWVRDFDETTVWFEIEGSGAGDNAGIFGQSYTQSEAGAVELTGDRAEVRVSTTYVPVNPAGRTTTEESEEDTMPQIEEARLRELEEASGRVPTLESERDTALQERDEARRERDEARGTIAESNRRERARVIITERSTAGDTHVEFTPLEVRGLLAELPLTEAGELDEAAFTTTVDAQIAEAIAGNGGGQVRGFGSTVVLSEDATDDQVREASDKARATAFGRKIAKEA